MACDYRFAIFWPVFLRFCIETAWWESDKLNFIEIARQAGFDEKTVRASFVEEVKKLEKGFQPENPAMPGIDENCHFMAPGIITRSRLATHCRV